MLFGFLHFALLDVAGDQATADIAHPVRELDVVGDAFGRHGVPSERSGAAWSSVEHDPITLAKSIATLDHLSGGRVSLGVGFGWNTDELADHNVPPARRRTMLREYLEAMRALWTEEEASYEGEFVNFGPSWA